MRQTQDVVLWMSDKLYELYHQTSSWRCFSSVRELCWLLMLRSKLARVMYHPRRLELLSPFHSLLYRVFYLQWNNLLCSFDSLNALSYISYLGILFGLVYLNRLVCDRRAFLNWTTFDLVCWFCLEWLDLTRECPIDLLDRRPNSNVDSMQSLYSRPTVWPINWRPPLSERSSSSLARIHRNDA